MNPLDRDVDFYYVTRHSEEAVFVEEIRTAANYHPRLKVNISSTATEGPLTIESITGNAGGNLVHHHIYMCCPLPMMLAYESMFRELHVSAGNIHYEEFNFR